MSAWEPQVGERVIVMPDPDCHHCAFDVAAGVTGTVGIVIKRPKSRGTKGHRFWVEYLFWFHLPVPPGDHIKWGFYRAAELRRTPLSEGGTDDRVDVSP
jgi:hypothetical protein